MFHLYIYLYRNLYRIYIMSLNPIIQFNNNDKKDFYILIGISIITILIVLTFNLGKDSEKNKLFNNNLFFMLGVIYC
jgi:hypothetical protein